MTKGKLGTTIIGLSALLMTSHTYADTAITMKDVADGAQTLIQIKDGKVRTQELGESGYSLYDKSRDLVIHVDTENRSYVEMDKDAIKMQSAALSKMMAAQMEKMRTLMQNMPPEQRAMMEAQMGGMMGKSPADAGSDEKLRTEKRGSKRVSGINCRIYELFDGQRKAAEICMATAKDAGISAGDYAALMAMLDFMRNMTRSMPAMGAPSDPLMAVDLKGVPMEMKGSEDGDDFTFTSLSRDKLDAGLFEVDKTFRKQDAVKQMMGEMMDE